MSRFFIYLTLLAISLTNISSAGFKFSTRHSTLKFTNSNASFDVKTPITNYTGTLEVKGNGMDSVSGTTTADTITFVNGIIKTGEVSAGFTGELDPNGTDVLTLNNNSILDVPSGTISQDIEVADNSTATILGQPRFSGNITLLGTNSVLQLGIATSLSQDISGSGTLRLLDNLTLNKNTQLPSKIEQDNKTVHLSGGSISSGFTNTTGGIIELDGNTDLSAALVIGSGSDDYTLNGNGMVLNMTGSGSITFNGANLYINDIHIKGFDDTNFIKGTGTIYFSKTTIEMGGNFTRNDGDFVFDGDPCRVITTGSTFTMSGSGNSLTVDGILLVYEQRDGSGTNPFGIVSSGSIVKINGGDIVPAPDLATESQIIDNTSYTLVKNLNLSTSSNLQLNNNTIGTPKSMTLNGGGHFMHFPTADGSFLDLDANVQLLLYNVLLKNWNHNGVNYGDANATLTFGDNTILEMDRNLTIATGDHAWTFNGNATIDGQGRTLKIDKANGVTITGAKTLILKNMHIITTVSNGLSALTGTASVRLENVTFESRQANYNFSQGNLEVTGLTELLSSATNAALATVFEFSSAGYLRIGNTTSSLNGTLKVNRNVTLRYNAQESTLNAADQKAHLIFAYPISTLHLDGATLQASTAGLLLQAGTFNVSDASILATGTTGTTDTQIKSDMFVNILSSAVLDVQGKVEYIA